MNLSNIVDGCNQLLSESWLALGITFRLSDRRRVRLLLLGMVKPNKLLGQQFNRLQKRNLPRSQSFQPQQLGLTIPAGAQQNVQGKSSDALRTGASLCLECRSIGAGSQCARD